MIFIRRCSSPVPNIRIKYLVFSATLILAGYLSGIFLYLLQDDYYTKFSYPLDIDMYNILETVKNGDKPKVQPINEYVYGYNIENIDKCKQEKNVFDNVRLLIVVKSAIDNFQKRNAIRKTWGWENRFSDVVIRRIFTVGLKNNDPSIQSQIDSENRIHKDIVQGNFIDGYYNNTIKMMMSFHWVMKNCPKMEFVLFADDDMYISIKNLLRFTRNPFGLETGVRKLLNEFPSDFNIFENKIDTPERTNSRNLLALYNNELTHQNPKTFDGRLYSGCVFFSSPIRFSMSKWFISLEDYRFSRYPPYCTGAAFVVSHSAFTDLYYTLQYLKYLPFDDVLIGIAAKKVGILPFHNENFYIDKKPYEKFSYANVISSHGYGDPEELQRIWEEQRSIGYA